MSGEPRDDRPSAPTEEGGAPGTQAESEEKVASGASPLGSPSVPRPATLRPLRPSTPSTPPSPMKRHGTMQGGTSGPSASTSTRPTPVSVPPPKGGSIPPPPQLPSLDGVSEEAPDEEGWSDAPSAKPVVSSPLPAPPAPPRASSPGEAPRHKSRRTVKIPDDEVPPPVGEVATFSSSSTSTDLPSPEEKASTPPDGPSTEPSASADEEVIQPMRIIAVAGSDEPVEGSTPPPAEEATASPSDEEAVASPSDEEAAASPSDEEAAAAAAPEPEAPQPVELAPSSSGATPPPLPKRTGSSGEHAAVVPPPLPKRSSGEHAAVAPPPPPPVEASSEVVELVDADDAIDEALAEEVEDEPPTKPSPPIEVRPEDEETLDEALDESVEEIEPDRISDLDLGETEATEPAAAQPKKPPPPPPPKRPPMATVPEPAAAAAQAASQAEREKPPPPPPPSLDPSRRRQKPWWEDLFSDDFIRTLDRLEPPFVQKECDFIEDRLGLEKGAVILDLGCGFGLQAVELASRGYSVVGYDLSLAMLAHAADEAQERAQKLNFLHGDMREMAFEDTFDGVYSWSTSFGYFDDEKNQNILTRIHRALRKGGMLLLDIINRDYIAPRQPSLVWFEGDGCVCMDEMNVDFFTSRLKVKRTVMFDDGRSRELDYSIRLYTLHELGKMLHDSGFKVLEVTGHPAHPGVFFGSESPRVIVLAERDG